MTASQTRVTWLLLSLLLPVLYVGVAAEWYFVSKSALEGDADVRLAVVAGFSTLVLFALRSKRQEAKRIIVVNRRDADRPPHLQS